MLVLSQVAGNVFAEYYVRHKGAGQLNIGLATVS